MIDHLDMQTNDFLENGARCDFIPDYSLLVERPGCDAQGNVRNAPPVGGRSVINIDHWGSQPVDSIFYCSPPPVENPEIIRPPTEPPKKSHKADRYGRVSVKRVEFIAYQAIEDFCNKVEGL